MVTPKEYERAVLERFRTIFPPPKFVVQHDIRLHGIHSKGRRQVDVAVFEAGKAHPSLIIEAKRYGRHIDVGHAGMTIGLVRDVGGPPAAMVASAGFSAAAQNQLSAEGIAHLTITIQEAQGLRWIGAITETFFVDHEFRELTGQVVESLRTGNPDPFLDLALPYEEWLAAFRTAQSLFPEPTSAVLLSLARDHYDDGVRFNATVLLDEADELTPSMISDLLAKEQDPETIELLLELSSY